MGTCRSAEAIILILLQSLLGFRLIRCLQRDHICVNNPLTGDRSAVEVWLPAADCVWLCLKQH